MSYTYDLCFFLSSLSLITATLYRNASVISVLIHLGNLAVQHLAGNRRELPALGRQAAVPFQRKSILQRKSVRSSGQTPPDEHHTNVTPLSQLSTKPGNQTRGAT